MTSVSLLDLLGVIGASLGAAGLLIAVLIPGRMDRLAGAIMGSGWVGIAIALSPPKLADRPPLLALGVVLGVMFCLCAGWLLRGRPGWLFFLGGLALPIRVPVEVGGSSANLLLPLYLIIGVALGAWLWGMGSERNPDRTRTVLDMSVGVMGALALVSVSWAFSVDDSILKAGTFVLPFALLYLICRRTWDGQLARRAAQGLGVTVFASALIGIYQHQTRTLWQNAKVEVANAFGSNFRTNSIFFDPNIYGRYLAVGVLALLAWQLLRRPAAKRTRIAIWIVIGIELLALWWTYSQSSLLALAAGCIALTAWVGSRRLRLVTYATLISAMVAGTLLLLLAPGLVMDSGRREVASTGVTLASLRPVQGLGLGSFEAGVTALANDRGGRAPGLRSSHTTPITFAAELGVLGIGVWAFFLAAAGAVATGTAGLAQRLIDKARSSGNEAFSLPLRQSAAAWGAAAVLAIVVHSMFYAAFLEDPLLWVAAAALGSGARLNARTAADHAPT